MVIDCRYNHLTSFFLLLAACNRHLFSLFQSDAMAGGELSGMGSLEEILMRATESEITENDHIPENCGGEEGGETSLVLQEQRYYLFIVNDVHDK